MRDLPPVRRPELVGDGTTPLGSADCMLLLGCEAAEEDGELCLEGWVHLVLYFCRRMRLRKELAEGYTILQDKRMNLGMVSVRIGIM